MSKIIDYVLCGNKECDMLIIMSVIIFVYFALNQFVNYHIIGLTVLPRAENCYLKFI